MFQINHYTCPRRSARKPSGLDCRGGRISSGLTGGLKWKSALLVGLVHLVGLAARAQEGYPRLELYGGGSFIRQGIQYEVGGIAKYGWQASVSGNFHRKLGVTADLGGQYNAGAQFYQYLLGPTFSGRSTGLFGRALFGGANVRPGKLPSATGFAMAFGGGADIRCGADAPVCWRAGPIDYIADHTSSQWTHSLRVGFGLVFKFHRSR